MSIDVGQAYLISKFVHIVVVGLLLGHSIISTWWLWRGFQFQDSKSSLLFFQSYIESEFIFGGIGVTAIFVTGISNIEILRLPFHTNFWAVTGASLLGLYLLTWLCILVPIQIRMSRIFKTGEIQKPYKIFRRWLTLKVLLVFMLILAMYVMVLKPASF
jgi:uncharacterized membrane protein